MEPACASEFPHCWSILITFQNNGRKSRDSRRGRASSQPGHVRSAAESGSEPSCRDATGTNTMAETANIDRPPAARAAVSRPRSAKTATVSASALAHHFDCSRTYIGKLEAEGVIQRQGDGFPLDRSRVALPATLAARAAAVTARGGRRGARQGKDRTATGQDHGKEKGADAGDRPRSPCRKRGRSVSDVPVIDACACAPLGDMQTRRRLEVRAD